MPRDDKPQTCVTAARRRPPTRTRPPRSTASRAEGALAPDDARASGARRRRSRPRPSAPPPGRASWRFPRPNTASPTDEGIHTHVPRRGPLARARTPRHRRTDRGQDRPLGLGKKTATSAHSSCQASIKMPPPGRWMLTGRVLDGNRHPRRSRPLARCEGKTPQRAHDPQRRGPRRAARMGRKFVLGQDIEAAMARAARKEAKG